MRQLLDTLSLWDLELHGRAGLMLMLSAFSPSDTEHRYFYCEMEKEYPFHYEEDLDICMPDILTYHAIRSAQAAPARHRHVHGILAAGEASRIFGTPLVLQSLRTRTEAGRLVRVESLPQTPIIQGVLIRRQFFRSIAVKSLAQLFRESFVAVETFRFERFAYFTKELERAFHQGMNNKTPVRSCLFA